MKRIYHPYTLWEDYLNGMWKKANKENEEIMLKKAIEFTGDYKKYGNAMINVVNNWKYTLEHNLTDNTINKKAFIGHCAVCYELGIPEYITRLAWSYLNNEQQYMANKQAEYAIKLWTKKQNEKKYVSKELFK
jgi:hypothetical protein